MRRVGFPFRRYFVAEQTFALRKYNLQALFWKRVLEFLNPAYHLRKLREELGLVQRSWRMRKELDFAKHDVTLQQLFRGKLFSIFMMSGPFGGLVALPVGYWFQRLTSNGFVGLFSTIAVVLVVTTTMYQVFWWHDNRILYQGIAHGYAKFAEMQRDLWPVHWFGIRTGFVMGFLGNIIATFIVGLVQANWPRAIEVVPMGTFAFILDVILVQGPFLRVMGDYFDKHSHVLAAKYDHIFTPS